MSEDEMFVSAVRSAGDEAGVFEYDGETGYFYLYETKGAENQKIIGAIRAVIGAPDFQEKEVEIRWNTAENKVGLFIRGRLWAAFDQRTGEKYGGIYRRGALADIPAEVAAAFETL